MVKCIKQLPCTLFCYVEIYEWFNIARKFFLSTEHTEDTETILVEDYSKDFVLDLPIGYDVTPKSWTVYLICFDVVSCIVQDSCRA